MIHLKNFVKWSLLIGGVIFWLTALVGLIANGPHERVYDCTIAEFHPDYPQEVKNECRKLKHGTSV